MKVWVRVKSPNSNHTVIYHTGENCPYFKNVQRKVLVDIETIASTKRKCPYCFG